MSFHDVNLEALKSEIRAAIISKKANACPMVARLAWHASGTYDKKDNSGGSNGATMRFDPEANEAANAGLSIIRDMLLPVRTNHPEISFADLWIMAGCFAIEFLGGPPIPFSLGRTDASDASFCPAGGRLPDAAKGADHIREVFYRMGFTDREIVALCGAHTLGRCHLVRSGYDGPWTHNPLRFDNAYYKNLVNLDWRPKKWDGPLQYEDVQTGKLMMLPSDMALIQDSEFKKYVELYAEDQAVFFQDFAAAFGKLLALGTKTRPVSELPERDRLAAEFRELAMHGSVGPARALLPRVDAHAAEAGSGRTALHKAAFWGHIDMIRFLVNECKLSLNAADYQGDTALHDAARFGHESVVKVLLESGADATIKNKHGMDAIAVANQYEKPHIAAILKKGGPRSRL